MEAHAFPDGKVFYGASAEGFGLLVTCTHRMKSLELGYFAEGGKIERGWTIIKSSVGVIVEEGYYTNRKLKQGTRMFDFGEGDKLFIDASEGGASVTVTTTKNTVKGTVSG